jgi:hypothetical protein
MLFYSSEPEALRSQLSNAFGFDSVDAGARWLIFALPSAELAVHPGEGPCSSPELATKSPLCATTSKRLLPTYAPREFRLTVSPKTEGGALLLR